MCIDERDGRRPTHRHPGRTARTALMTGVLAGLLVSCTTEGVLAPSARIDAATSVGAIAPPMTQPMAAPVPSEDFYQSTEPSRIPLEPVPQASYGAPQASVSALPSYGSLTGAQGGGQAAIPPDPYAAPAASLPAGWNVGPAPAGQVQPTTTFSAAPPVTSPAPGLAGLAGPSPMPEDYGMQPEPRTVAVAPVFEAAPPSQMQPVSVAPQAMSAPLPPATQPEMESAPVRVAPEPERQEPRRFAGLLPRALNPLARSSDPYAGLPAEEAECQRRLKRLGVTFTAKPPVGNGGSCGIANPVEVASLSGDIRIQPATTLNCQMAEALAQWVKNELAPATRKRYLSGIRTIGSMGGYSCRTMNSRRGAPMSEHARGNAMDIGKITLNNGRSILVREKGFFAFRERGLLASARNDGCKYFTTVLGPGSDANHADHFHFDLRARRNGYRHCD